MFGEPSHRLIAVVMVAAFAATAHAGTDRATVPPVQKVFEAQGKAAITSHVARRPSSLQPGGPANPKVYGRTYGEWGGAWWQWAFSIPEGVNPVEDETGEHCDIGQSGPVWFLAGSFGVTGVERTCTIPAGKAIFYPLVNSVWADCPNSSDEDLSDEEVRWILATFTSSGDNACQLTSTLDTFTVFGDEVPAAISALSRPAAVRSQSPVFTLDLPENHIADFGCEPPIPPGETGRSIAEGYWVMLPPLSIGEHTLNLHGAGCDPETGEVLFETEVTYHLTVMPGRGANDE